MTANYFICLGVLCQWFRSLGTSVDTIRSLYLSYPLYYNTGTYEYVKCYKLYNQVKSFHAVIVNHRNSEKQIYKIKLVKTKLTCTYNYIQFIECTHEEEANAGSPTYRRTNVNPQI